MKIANFVHNKPSEIDADKSNHKRLQLSLEMHVIPMLYLTAVLNQSRFIRRNRSCSTRDSAYSYTFLRSVVCLSVVCLLHSCSPYSETVRWVLMPHGRYTCGVQWHIVLDGCRTPRRKGRFEGRIRPKHAITNCSQTVSPMLPPGEYKRGVGRTCHSDSAYWQIRPTLFLVITPI